MGVAEALGGPVPILMTALGVPVTERDGRLLVALRPLAERLNLPYQYSQADDTFYVDAIPELPALPNEPVGAAVRPWHPVIPVITSDLANRGPELLDRVLQQYYVDRNPRYRHNQQGHGETYCNIYVWDCTRALGCEIPHWVDWAGSPAAVGAGRELDANGVVLWLRRQGLEYGWKEVSGTEAGAAANEGRPALTAWLNPAGIGHVAMVRPGTAHPNRGLPIAQSGLTNADNIYLVDGFGRATSEVEYYVHD